jgi:hypothetical protein
MDTAVKNRTARHGRAEPDTARHQVGFHRASNEPAGIHRQEMPGRIAEVTRLRSGRRFHFRHKVCNADLEKRRLQCDGVVGGNDDRLGKFLRLLGNAKAGGMILVRRFFPARRPAAGWGFPGMVRCHRAAANRTRDNESQHDCDDVAEEIHRAMCKRYAEFLFPHRRKFLTALS